MGRPLPFTNPAPWSDHYPYSRKAVNDRAIDDGLLGTEYSPYEEYPYRHPPRSKLSWRERWANNRRINKYGGPPYYSPTHAKFTITLPKGDEGFLFVIYEEIESTHSPKPDYKPVYYCEANDMPWEFELKTNTIYARSVVVNGQHRFRRFKTTFYSDSAQSQHGYTSRVEWLD